MTKPDCYNKLPYWDVKVVKVKKQEAKCKHFMSRYIPNKKKYQCCRCGKYLIKNNYGALKVIQENEGNWVNGENLDRIKFPCVCSYKATNVTRGYGMILTDSKGYHLHYIVKQISPVTTLVGSRECLIDLIKDYKVKILKGKIIIFEEEVSKVNVYKKAL